MSTRMQTPRRYPQRPDPPSSSPSATSYRVAWWAGIGLVVALLVAIAVVVVRAAGDDSAPPATGSELVAPRGLTTDGWIAVGDGPVTVTVYFDYLCPACAAFERANGDELERLLEAGEITVELRPIAFLDRLSAGSEYSTRSANALATVVEDDPALVWRFHRALYGDQPAEGEAGHPDEQLAAIARDAGVPAEVASQFADHRFSAWVLDRTEQAFADGVRATPTILVDGEVFEGDPYSVGPLTTAVEQAHG